MEYSIHGVAEVLAPDSFSPPDEYEASWINIRIAAAW